MGILSNTKARCMNCADKNMCNLYIAIESNEDCMVCEHWVGEDEPAIAPKI